MLLLADGAFQTQNDLLGNLGFLLEHWLSLTTIARLFTIVTAFTLGKERSLTSCILGDLMGSVLAALLGSAEGVTCFRDIHLEGTEI